VRKLFLGKHRASFLRSIALLLHKQEGHWAQWIILLRQLKTLAAHEPVELAAKTHLGKELLQHMRAVLHHPGLIEDLVDVLKNPQWVEGFQQSLVWLLRHQGQPTEQDFERAQRPEQFFVQRARSASTDARDQRSYWMRLLHLLADTAGVRYRSVLRSTMGVRIPFLEMDVPDIGAFVLRSVLGKAVIWDVLKQNGQPLRNGPIKNSLRKALPAMGLSERPTPEEFARFINRPPVFSRVPFWGLKLNLQLQPILGKDGYELRKHQGNALYAGVRSGLLKDPRTGLGPILHVFEKHNCFHLLLQILGTIHRHWGKSTRFHNKRGEAIYTAQSNLRSAEPLLIEVLTQTALGMQVSKLSSMLTRYRFLDRKRSPKPVLRPILGTLRYLLGASDARDVKRPWSHAPWGDFYKHLSQLRRLWGQYPSSQTAELWGQVAQRLETLWLKPGKHLHQTKFASPQLMLTTRVLLERLALEMERSQADVRWAQRTQRLLERLTAFLKTPLMASGLKLAVSLGRDAQTMNILQDWLLDVLLASPEQDDFAQVLHIWTTWFQPVDRTSVAVKVRFLGHVLLTKPRLVPRLAYTLARALNVRKADAFVSFLSRGAAKHPAQPMSNLDLCAEALMATLRLQPGSTAPFSVEDLMQILGAWRGFFDSDSAQSRFQRWVQLVDRRER
ncbi:MAG: hypothetical protein AAGJ35_04135, partial [Myxococcota bacterium]